MHYAKCNSVTKVPNCANSSNTSGTHSIMPPSSSNQIKGSFMFPTTQKQRIIWATRHRKIFLFPDNDIYKPEIPVVESDANIEDFKLAQIRYEKRYRDEKRRFEKEKAEKKEKQERALGELLEKHPDLVSEVVVQPRSTTSLRRPSSQLISKKRSRADGDDKDRDKDNLDKDDEDKGNDIDNEDKDKDKDKDENDNETRRAPVSKRLKTVSNAHHKAEYGDIYENPCGECAKHDRPCHEQIPRPLSCWECHRARTACPFVVTARKKKTTRPRRVESISFSSLPPSEDEDNNRFENEQSSRVTLGSSLEDIDITDSELVKVIKKTANALDQNLKFLTERVVLMSADIRTMADYVRKKNGEPILGPIDGGLGGQRSGSGAGKPQSEAGEKWMKDR